VSRAVERLVNLAMYLASAREPVSAEDVRANVEGYSKEQDQTAFLRMFERDKEDLRGAGFVILSDAEGAYRLDASATFVSEVALSSDEASTIRVVGSAFTDDDSFPFREDLRLALAKIASSLRSDETPVFSRLAEESPARQAAAVALFDAAISACKRVTFGYVNSAGEHKAHDLEPYGLFIRDGRWYVVGRDRDLDEVRIYAVSRIQEPVTNKAKPKTPNFERPPDFDVRTFVALPFQYGDEPFEVLISFAPSQTWRAEAVTAGVGTLTAREDESLAWAVTARHADRLMRWVVENGPGVSLRAPEALAARLRERLTRVAELHG
jgi:proteasome accessory factor B